MRKYKFFLIFKNRIKFSDDGLPETFMEPRCHDCLIVRGENNDAVVSVCRESETLRKAIRTAIKDVEYSGHSLKAVLIKKYQV